MLKVCTSCGFTWDEISGTHLAGCSVCYEVFEREIMLDYHGWHGSRAPLQSLKKDDLDTREQDQFALLSGLREKLSRALIEENFEEAGEIKKKLSRLEGSDGLD